jgi:hypothetical protein
VKLHAHRDLLGKINFYPERAGLGAMVTLFRNGAVYVRDGIKEAECALFQ